MWDEFLDEDGRLLKRPTDTKTRVDLDRVIGLGKPTRVINIIINLVNITNDWEWAYDYMYYENDLYNWLNWEPEITYDDDGEELYRTEQPPEPVEPIRPTAIPFIQGD